MTVATMHATAALDDRTFHDVRRRTIFECCKFDPQVEDVSVLAPYALLIGEATWRELAAAAERLERELLDAERELITRPALLKRLGLPRGFRRALRDVTHCPAPSLKEAGDAPRVTRYDFHLTSSGWRISEANTDVPGGFIEGAGFTRLMREAIGGDVALAGDPVESLARAIANRGWKNVGLVHATAFSDDRQVMMYLRQRFAAFGLTCELMAPDHVQWSVARASRPCAFTNARDGRATPDGRLIDAIVRFFPAEWLPQLPKRLGWRHFMGACDTPLISPATALVTQSKRFPLVWDELSTPLPSWHALLPETRDPRHVDWRDRAAWVLKPALGRVGDMIGVIGATSEKDWKRIERRVRWFPSHWACQRRFEALPVETPDGSRFAALGVFVIDGQAAGVYGRIAPAPLINHLAQDVAVLVGRAAGHLSSTRSAHGRDARATALCQTSLAISQPSSSGEAAAHAVA